MPELGFILTVDEELALIQLVLERGGVLFPDLRYETDHPTRIVSVDEYHVQRHRTRLFFVVQASYNLAPLQMEDVAQVGPPSYRISQRTSCPTIDFLSTVRFEEDGKIKMNPGFLAYHKTIWNPLERRFEDVPKALPSEYRLFCGRIRKMATQQKIGVRTYWIGHGVQRLLDSGAIELGLI